MRLVLVTGLVLVMVLLRRAPSRLVSMTGCRAGPEAEAAFHQLLASRQQTRLHAWRRMAYANEKRNVKRAREHGKRRRHPTKQGDNRHSTDHHLEAISTAQASVSTDHQLHGISTRLQCVCVYIGMPHNMPHEDDDAECMSAHPASAAVASGCMYVGTSSIHTQPHRASTYSRVYVGRRRHCKSTWGHLLSSTFYSSTLHTRGRRGMTLQKTCL